MQEIREWFDGPLALSGAIATGGAILAAQAMGADLAYIGSAFIATEEARAIEDYKQAIVDGRAEDIVGSNLFTGVFGNYLRPSIVRAGLDPDNLPAGRRQDDGFRLRRRRRSAKAWRDIWGSGQGIGAVKAVTPAAELVARLAKREYAAAKARLCAELSATSSKSLCTSRDEFARPAVNRGQFRARSGRATRLANARVA